jgi:hypothetical protein
MSVVLAARALHAALQHFDPALLTGDDCAVIVAELARVENASAAARARAAMRSIACGSHRRDGVDSPREWLARQTGTSSGEAQAVLDTAQLAERCPSTRDAMRRGDISMAIAREITKSEAAVPGSETGLLELARKEPLHVLKAKARERRLAHVDPEDLRARQRSAREFRHWRDDLGMVRITGALLPEDGVALLSRLEAEADRLWRGDREKRSDSRDQLLADAFVRMLEGKGKGRYRQSEVVVVVDSRKLLDGDTAAGPCHVIGGGPVPVSVAREIARDAFLKVVLHDGVDVQKVAHVGRYQPAHLRTALLLGPPPDFEGVVCAEEGCGRQLGVQWDHIDPIANGGLTALSNERPRCVPHHREKTERDRKAGSLGNTWRRPP